MNTRVLLIGMGADIGANLLYLSATGGFEHRITDVLTNPVSSEGVGADRRGPLDELAARLLLANPVLLGRISTFPDSNTLGIDAVRFRVHFRNLDDELDDLRDFDLAILATSRTHIRSRHYLEKVEKIATVVLGVAENPEIPALYPALTTAPPEHFAHGGLQEARSLSGSFALGSCQCAGWTTGVRILADYCESRDLRLSDVLVHAELDIVHPDTASSSFGTKRIGARSEDARDNLRPGTSQVIDSMLRFAPATSNNAVSLRIPTQPPGFQIQRFFLDVDDVQADDLAASARAFAAAEPHQLRIAESPLGSRAYAAMLSSTALLDTEHHLGARRIGTTTQVVMQTFVHNTTGYCAAIIDAMNTALSDRHVVVFEPATTRRRSADRGVSRPDAACASAAL